MCSFKSETPTVSNGLDLIQYIAVIAIYWHLCSIVEDG